MDPMIVAIVIVGVLFTAACAYINHRDGWDDL